MKYLFVVVLAASVFSCKKDNYDAPSSTLSGNLLYQGDTIYLEKEQVPVLVYEYGFGKVGPIGTLTQYPGRTYTNVTPTFTQEGTYSLLLYDGDYKIVIPNGQGPFLWKQTAAGNPDTVNVTLKGSQTVNLDVTPYYMIRSTQISAAGTDSIKATVSIEKIITDANAKDIQSVSLYVSKTKFVSGSDNINDPDFPNSIAGSAITDLNNIQIGARYKAPATTQNYYFARVGLRIAGAEDMIFSPLFKIQL